MKKLPDAELELMMIIWDAERPITRMEIEEHMDEERDVLPSTILSFLSRLEKRGKINYYSAAIEKEPYLKEAGKNFLKKMFQGSLANFAASLYGDEELSQKETEELIKFIEKQK